MPEASIGDGIVITPVHREVVHRNGVIEAGPFRITIDNDMVRNEVRKSPDLPSLIYQFRILEEVGRLHNRLYVLVIADPQARPPPLENRRWAANWYHRFGANALAIVAPGNILFATAMKLVLRARNLFLRNQRPVAFFPTEAEAHAWIEGLRGSQKERRLP